jgi:hypothetical protein
MPFVIGIGKVQAIAKDDATLSLFCLGSAHISRLERRALVLTLSDVG